MSEPDEEEPVSKNLKNLADGFRMSPHYEARYNRVMDRALAEVEELERATGTKAPEPPPGAPTKEADRMCWLCNPMPCICEMEQEFFGSVDTGPEIVPREEDGVG